MQQNEQWEISRGAPIDDYGRPPVDHTNGHGFYIYTTSKAQPIKPRRIIIITFDIELKISCLSLWYYKYGMTPGHLNIYTVVKEREEILYSMIDRRTQLWSQFQANVYNATQIILEYNFTDTNVGGIALDDIYISPISCEVTDTSRKRFDNTKLQRPEVRKAFSIELKNRFQLLDELEDIETFWEGITKCYKEAATNTLGFKERGQKPWISNESWKLVDERRKLKERTNNSRSERVKNNLHAKYSDKDKEVKKNEKPFLHACIEKDEELYIRCPVSNVLKEAFAFDSNQTMSCQTTTVQIENNLQQKFRTCNKTPTCKFTPADIVNENNCFNVSKQLQLTYSCINGTEQTTSKTNDENTISTSPQTETTTSVAKRTQTVTSTPQTNVITESLQSDSPSSTPVIGIVVGVVLSLIALSVFLVIAFLYFRRYRYAEKKGHSIVANEDSHSDYTGHQNIAFSPEVNVTTQTDYCEIRKSKLNEHYHDISDTLSPSINTTNDDKYSVIANGVNSPNSNPNPSTNYQHQYISLDPNATGFDRSNPQTNLLNESKNNHNSNEKTSFTSGDDYAILDPDDLNESKNNTPKVLPLSDNYVVLDPNETGFNRQENTDRVCNYDLATPTVTSEDPYDVSKDETYDTSSNSRHKEKENNIYSHTVDNVYDTAGNQRKKEESDGTYDHFFGQKSEDDYDISKPI
ncbi:unnamed protein product [Mytilus coruscus]|uniref:MAM domain-containing protein n=1 Tax=Mytilus coruscus TaxID=42192 RepID=A0A6J8DS93_MYTCO|nr:unnamed protein product [Mytilus coruscus]